jgi:hypothetical protein
MEVDVTGIRRIRYPASQGNSEEAGAGWPLGWQQS